MEGINLSQIKSNSNSNSQSSSRSNSNEKDLEIKFAPKRKDVRKIIRALAKKTGRTHLAKKFGDKEQKSPVKQTTLNPALMANRSKGGMSA